MKVIIEIKNTNYSFFINYLISQNIFYKIINVRDNSICLKVDYKDYLILCKKYDVILIKRCGIYYYIDFVTNNYLILISILITYIILIILSNIIFKIEIISDNNTLIDNINEVLLDNNIVKYKFFKSYKEINSIKEKIINNNKDTIEWIEFKREGTKYTIYVSERKIENIINDKRPSNIIASKEATIRDILVNNGTKMVEKDMLVKPGDVLISGNIYKNEDIVDSVNANGIVYGEVWYSVNISVPFKHVEYISLNKVINHIYIDFFGKKMTLFGKYKTNKSMSETKVIIDKPYLFFKVYNERISLFDYMDVKLTEKEAFDEAIKRCDDSIINKLNKDEYIIAKKVLKKEVNSSTIKIEMFYRVNENIGQEILVEGDL